MLVTQSMPDGFDLEKCEAEEKRKSAYKVAMDLLYHCHNNLFSRCNRFSNQLIY